jgi:O-antigen/teichoic acid export membrane protein
MQKMIEPVSPTVRPKGSLLTRLASHPLVGHSLVFVGAEAFNKALPFFLLPVLTRCLSTADYGIVATFLALQNILSVIVGLSTHGAISVAYFRLSSDALKEYVASVVTILGCSVALSLILMGVASPFLAHRLGIALAWLLLAVVLAGAQFLTQINLLLWQCERRPLPYAAYQIAQAVLGALMTILLVVGLGLGWRGQILSTSIAALLFSLLSLVFLIRRGYLGRKVSRAAIQDALAFGIPLVPHALSGWIMTGIDRIILTFILGSSATGVYAAGYQIALIIGIIANAFNRAWVPYLYEKLGSATHVVKIRLVKITYTYFIAITALALILSKIALPLISIYLGARYKLASSYVLWIALGYAFDGMYYMVVNQIFFAKRTRILSSITLAVGVLHALLSYTLIRANGALGAAQATTLSFSLQFILVWIASARIYPMPWRLRTEATKEFT